jgi:hypothetical protein
VVDGHVIALVPGRAGYDAFTCQADDPPAWVGIAADSVCCTLLLAVAGIAGLAGNDSAVTTVVTASVRSVDRTNLAEPLINLISEPALSYLAGSTGPEIAPW